jgi:hypothetical protein
MKIPTSEVALMNVLSRLDYRFCALLCRHIISMYDHEYDDDRRVGY